MTLRGLFHRTVPAAVTPCWVCLPDVSSGGRMCPAHERQVRDTAMAEGPGYRAIPRQRNGSGVTR